jgi:hypothetical protein
MSMMYLETSSIVAVTGALQCVYDALGDTVAGYPNRFCPLVPGEIAWDECDCGQLAGTINDIFPAGNFPAAANDTPQTKCGPPLIVVSATLSLVRCVPTVNNNGKPPECAKLLESAVTLEIDRFTARRALRCCLNGMYSRLEIANFSIGGASAVGPEGMCAGFIMPFFIGFTNDGCCDE